MVSTYDEDGRGMPLPPITSAVSSANADAAVNAEVSPIAAAPVPASNA
ncbi:MAG: hypothetical protein ACRDTN_00460 [Mycobacterium sp.]